jgi:DUF4097 and DUF4098 domain-containing protein YvlB
MERSFATPRDVVVSVENEVGLVVVTGLDTATTSVSLEASTAGGEELVQRAIVESQQMGDHDVIRVRIPHAHGMKFVRRNGVTVRIDMPAAGDVEVKTASADVELNGTLGDVSVKSASGDVTADEASGDVRITSASGDLSIDDVGGDLRMDTASGDARAVSVRGRFSVNNRSGDIEVGSVGACADIRSTSGDVRVGDLAGDSSIVGVSGDVRVLSFEAGQLQVRSVSGDITVGIPHGTSFKVDAQSMSGSVQSEIPLDEAPTSSGGPLVSVVARSVSGDFLMERAVGALVP